MRLRGIPKGGPGWGGGCVRRIMRLIGSWGRGSLIVGGGRRGGGRGGRMGHATRNERGSRFTRATEKMASCFVMYDGRLRG